MKILVKENGHISNDGLLKIYNRDRFLHRCGNHADTNIELYIVERSGGFTSPMRKYYFTVVVPEICNAYRYYGYEYSKDEIDYRLRMQALYSEKYDPVNDRWIREPHRLSNDSSTVTFNQFKEYLEWCIRFAAEELNWSIGFPNEILQREDLTSTQLNNLDKNEKRKLCIKEVENYQRRVGNDVQ